VIKSAEQFYTGIGFAKLREFLGKVRSLPSRYRQPAQKNTHASCWHIDLASDIRSLQSSSPTRSGSPPLIHEPGTAIIMNYRARGAAIAAYRCDPAFTRLRRTHRTRGGTGPVPEIARLLPRISSRMKRVPPRHALGTGIPFMFWASGVMTHWKPTSTPQSSRRPVERALVAIRPRPPRPSEPPTARGEEWCDPATKTHINDTPAYYYSYAVAEVFKHQLHDYIAKKSLHQPRKTAITRTTRKSETFLRKIMVKGATEDWRKVLKGSHREDLSTRAMLEYYQPLMAWLQEQKQRPPHRLGVKSADRASYPNALCYSDFGNADGPSSAVDDAEHRPYPRSHGKSFNSRWTPVLYRVASRCIKPACASASE